MVERLHHLLVYIGLLVLFFVPVIIVSGQEITWSPYTVLRIAGLLGFISLSLGAILNLMKKQINNFFGKPFLKIHHYFAITGLVLITIHPALYVLLAQDLRVLVPDISSLYSFFSMGGRVAILFFYGAFLAGIFRMALTHRWRYIHLLVYPAIIIAAIHANLIGQTMTNLVVLLLINGLTGIVCITFVYTRLRRMKKKNR